MTRRDFVFSTLTAILFSLHHVVIYLADVFRFVLISFIVLPETDIVLSSAYTSNTTSIISNGMSFMNKMNNSGPKIEPCGTPDFTTSGSEMLFLKLTICELNQSSVNQ